MSLLTVLLALLIERHLGSAESMRRFEWWDRYVEQAQARLEKVEKLKGLPGVLLTYLLPVLAIAVVQMVFIDWWLPFAFLFALFVLIYSLGPRDLEAEVEAILDARGRNDEESADLHLRALLGDDYANDAGSVNRQVMETTLIESNERLLGVIFWFVLLGPAGALLYRISCRARRQHAGREDDFAQAIIAFHEGLAWLPARLSALGFAFSGSFVDAMNLWRHEGHRCPEGSCGVLIASGMGAMQLDAVVLEEEGAAEQLNDDSIRETLSLVRRSVYVWLAFLALLTLAGWTG